MPVPPRTIRRQETAMTATKTFASQADLEEKKVSFTKLSDHA